MCKLTNERLLLACVRPFTVRAELIDRWSHVFWMNDTQCNLARFWLLTSVTVHLYVCVDVIDFSWHSIKPDIVVFVRMIDCNDTWPEEKKNIFFHLNADAFVKKCNSLPVFIDPQVPSILLVDHMDWPRYPQIWWRQLHLRAPWKCSSWVEQVVFTHYKVSDWIINEDHFSFLQIYYLMLGKSDVSIVKDGCVTTSVLFL